MRIKAIAEVMNLQAFPCVIRTLCGPTPTAPGTPLYPTGPYPTGEVL